MTEGNTPNADNMVHAKDYFSFLLVMEYHWDCGRWCRGGVEVATS